MASYFLGLDPSLNSPSCVVIDYKHNLIDYLVIGTVKKYSKLNHYLFIPYKSKEENFKIKRLEFICNNIFDFIYKYKDSKIGIEGYSYSSVSRSVYELGEFAGVIKYKLFTNDIKFNIIEPTLMKKIITGKGNAKKEIVQERLKHYHSYLEDKFEEYGNYKNDLFDAFGIAKTTMLI